MCLPSIFESTTEHKKLLYTDMFDLAYFSNGSLKINEIYDLPVSVRKSYMVHLKELKDEEKKQIESPKGGKGNTNKPVIPSFVRPKGI